jgi:phage terminase large subunit
VPELELPAHGWAPRPAQMPLWEYLEGGGKRAILHAHRRFGKDDVALHWTACAAHERVGTYWHMLPEAAQARKAIWDAVNPHTGIRRIDEAFPKGLRDVTRENEMFIRFKCGSTWQVVGSDNYKSLVGSPPVGVVFSEWAKAHPGAWAYLAPILVENGGWMLAITTPEGRNHSYAMHKMAQQDPAWYSDVITIEDNIRMCLDAGIEPTISLADIEAQRTEYRALFGAEAGDALIEQEWWVSFQAATLGAYYGKQLEKLEREGRLCSLDRVPGYPVNTAWDIGVDDPMAIWVFQTGPGWLHILDYVEGSNEGFDFYCDWLAERGYVPTRDDRGQLRGVDYVPHDARQREPGAPGARTRIQTLFSLGRNPSLVPNHKPMDRVNAGRRLLAMPGTHFDGERCAIGLEMLRAYKQRWDVNNRVFMKSPLHNFASHGADAWGHLAVAVEHPKIIQTKPKQTKIEVPPLTVNDLLRNTKRERNWV